MTTPRNVGVGDRYRAARLRVTALLESIDDNQWEAQVDACPGWRVRDVLAHLVGVIEDALEGRIDGPPGPSQTAAEVDRHRDDEPLDLLRRWSTLAPPLEAVLTERSIWPALIDVLSHEHDIRAAIGAVGERNHPDLVRVARLLADGLPDGVTVDFGDESGPHGGTLCVSPFEFFRLRLGRRSRDQVVALDWRVDPEPFVDRLFVFGPAADDVVE